jgi:mono/diheme cytochrome c family protein
MSLAMTQITQTRPRRYILVIMVILIAGAGAAGALSWTRPIPPIKPPDRASFAASDVTRGAALAALGDCAVCHTKENGPPYAGSRGVRTPFGTVYATNITPDPETGIGSWSLAAFRRAMQTGIDREGRNLYPVLPYPHFIRATDDDIAAIYAFLMTRDPVRQKAPLNALPFPFNWRPLLVGWNLLFLHPGVWQPDPAKGADWNRGAYLVEAIGHCGACHTPHNILGAEKSGQALAGGEAEDWYAPALQNGSPAPQAWTIDALTTYLRTGFDTGHGAAAGPMAPVTHRLATVPDVDARAIAVYIASLMPQPVRTGAVSPASRPTGDAQAMAMFAGACDGCHGADAPMTRGGAPSLALNTAVNAPTARNVVEVILHGLPWREGEAGPYMPGFANALTDAQIAALTAYVRTRYSERPEWHGIDATVREARRQGGDT